MNLQLDHFSDDKQQLQNKVYLDKLLEAFSLSFRNKLSAATKRRHRRVVDCIVENLLWVTRKRQDFGDFPSFSLFTREEIWETLRPVLGQRFQS